MNKLGLLLGIVLALIGCGSNGPVTTTDTKASEDAFVATGTVQSDRTPNLLDRTRIGLIRQGEKLRVGLDQETALSIFPEPKRSFSMTEIPPGFGEGYRSRGWETNNEGLGVLFLNDRVAAAMYQLEDTDEARAEEISELYARDLAGLEGETISGAHVKYRFWNDNSHRLVLNTVKGLKGRVTIMVAMGDASVLDRLRLNERYAREDLARAEREFTRKQNNAKQ
jgi:hypothetical protein